MRHACRVGESRALKGRRNGRGRLKVNGTEQVIYDGGTGEDGRG